MIEYPSSDEDELEEEEEELLTQVQEVVSVPVNRLRVHKLSKTIYRERKNSREIKHLAENMRIIGQLEPIVITSDDIILSGVRRWYATMKLGLSEINAIVSNNLDEEKQAEIIVSHNRQRVKKPWQIINEAEAILGILGKNQGRRNDLLDSDKSNPDGRIGKDRFEIAATILGSGYGGRSIRRLIYVSDFEKESEENKKLGLLDKVLKKDLKAYRAEILIKDFKKQKEEREKAKRKRKDTKSISGSSSPFKIYNKSSSDMSEVKSGTVQVVFTSPPYWNLRNYGINTKGETPLGLERTPQEFITSLSRHLMDVKRVLSDEGSFFLNIGDTYRKGSNFLIPERLLLNLCDNEGWFIVNEIIWKKTSVTPQSKLKRLLPVYEKVFHLVKNPDKYYYQEFRNWKENDEISLQKIRGSRTAKSSERAQTKFVLSKSYERFSDFLDGQHVRNIINGSNAATRQNELKKLDVTVEHPALMPLYLPIIPILTTSREGDIILDTFSGSATTGKISIIFGRKFIGYELNSEFADLSIRDLNNTVESLLNDSPEKHKAPSLKKGVGGTMFDQGRKVVHRKAHGSKK